MARARPCALLALAYAKAPSPTARRLLDVRGLHLALGFRSVSSLPLLDHRGWVWSVLGCRPLVLARRRLALRPERAHSDCRADSRGAPIPRAHGRGGPPFPSCSSPARFARARQGSGGLRESGVRLWRAFLSADANEPLRRLSLLLRVRFACPLGGGGCLASSASSGLSPLGRCRRFGSLAPALPVHVVLGSPAGTANADGSSLPTTARPSSSVTHPAHDDVRGHAGSARRRDSLRRPPPPQGARMFRA